MRSLPGGPLSTSSFYESGRCVSERANGGLKFLLHTVGDFKWLMSDVSRPGKCPGKIEGPACAGSSLRCRRLFGRDYLGEGEAYEDRKGA